MNRTFLSAVLAAALCIDISTAGAASLYAPASTFKLDGMNPHSAVIADFNADGTDDLAAVFPIIDKLSGAVTGSRLNFLAGNAAGNLKIETTASRPFDVRSMATGDFDGDGQPDLAVAQKLPAGGSVECGANEGPVIYFGFHKEVQPDIRYGGCVTSVAAADLTALDANGDGLDDLIIGDELLLGDGSFTPSATLPAGDKNIADINGDGIPDAMTGTEAVCGLGDGTFAACAVLANDILVDTNANGQIVTGNGYNTSALNDAVMNRASQPSADLNGDGIDDFVGWAVTSLRTPIVTYWRSRSWHLTTVRSFRKRAGAGRGSGYYISRRMWLYSCYTSNYPRTGWQQVSYSSNTVVPATSALRISLVGADGSINQGTGVDVSGVFRALMLTDTDEDGIVDVLANIGQATSAPYEVTWDTSGLMTGAYTLKAVATDSAGNRATAKISVTVNGAAPAPAPAPAPTPSTAQPTGQTIEFAGVVSEVGSGYFVVGGLRVNYNATSIMKYNTSTSTPKVGDAVQGKADEYSDGTGVAIKAEFG